MSTTTAPRAGELPITPVEGRVQVGPIGRVGRYTATHFRKVLTGWLLVAVVLGFFAPRVEKALSGAGWEASGSQSVQARKLVERDFAGLGSYGLMTVVYSPTQTVGSPAFRSVASPGRTDAAGQRGRADGDRACSCTVDQPRRAYRDRDRRRSAQPEADGARRRPPQGPAEEARHSGRVRQPDRRFRGCGRTSTLPTARR